MSRKHITNFRGEFTPEREMRIKDEPTTPIDEDFGETSVKMRKSTSMSDITSIREGLIKDASHDSSNDIYSRQGLSKTKFVSMAEAIYHFQKDTPGRFHSTRPQVFTFQGTSGRSELTKPQSPFLRVASRSRPQHILSDQEKEKIQLEKLKTYKIKANPIPKAVFDGPINLPQISKKPLTVIEPFNLTEIHKKPKEVQSPALKFKARPAPKRILEKPSLPPKVVPSIKPVQPKLKHRRSKSQENIAKPQKDQTQKLLLVPFSFDKFDAERKKQKEERIRQQIENEKKQASSFKAKPLSGAVKKQMKHTNTKCSSSTTSSTDIKENHPKFEAQRPAVLYKDPFKPVLKQTQSIPKQFNLNNQKRAAERKKFNKQLKEKEEETERLRQEREKHEQVAVEQEQAELRANLEHCARPVPNQPAFHAVKSDVPLTTPETPTFVRRLNQN